MKMSDRELMRYIESGRGLPPMDGHESPIRFEEPTRPQRRTSCDRDINAKLDKILERLDAIERSINHTSSQISEQNMHWDMYTM